MRLFDRKTFMTLPAGTIFCKGKPWFFSDICRKGDTWDTDFLVQSFNMPDGNDSGEVSDRLEEMLATGASYPMEWAEGRDGMFDHEDLFLVFEQDDLRKLRGVIDEALALPPLATAPSHREED